METSPDTRDVPVKGRNIVVKRPTDAQFLLLARETRLAQKEATDRGRRLEAIGRVFDILESVVISPDDKDFLMEQTVAGDLELADLTTFLSAFNEDEDEKPKVRRGRAPAKRPV